MKYDYQCKSCQNEFEVEIITTSKLESRRTTKVTCPICKEKDQKKLVKLIRPTPIIYKGSGFYKTDNRK